MKYGFPSVLGAKIGCPDTPVVGFAGDGAFGISMSEMTSCSREEWPNITMVIFRNTISLTDDEKRSAQE